MLIKLNGTPLTPIVEATKEGINIEYDVSDILVDAYSVVHTPINVDLSFAGHNIIKGDINSFNWVQSIVESGVEGIGIALKSIF